MDIQRAAKQIGKAQHIVDLIGVIRAPGGNNCILAHCVGILRGDFRVGVGHGKNNRVFGHGFNHILGYRPLGRHPQKHIRPLHRFFQPAQVGFDRMGRFPLVHALGAALIDNPLGITNDTIIVPGPHGFEQFDTGNARRARTIEHNPAFLDFFAGNMQSVDQPRSADHRRAVLVIMENRYIHDFFQLLLDDKALGRFDILKVDTAKCRSHQLDRVDERVRILGIQLYIDRVNVSKALEKHRLALHHRLGGQRAKIAHAQYRGAVGNNRHHITLGGIIISQRRVVCYRLHRHGHTGGIGQ